MIPSLVSLLVLIVISARADLNVDSCFAVPGRKAPYTACFFPSHCLPRSNSRSSTSALVESNIFELLDAKDKMKNCFAFVGIRKFTGTKWLVTMQLVDPIHELTVRVGGQTLFSCKSDGNTVTVDTGSINHEIYKKIVRGDSLLCKFIVKNTGLNIISSGSDFSLVLPNNRAYTVMSSSVYGLASAAERKSCDGGFQFPNNPLPDQTWIRPLVEYDKVQCELNDRGEVDGKLVFMRKTQPIEASIECIGSYLSSTYDIKAKDGVTNVDRSLPLGCTVKTCTRCGEVTALSGTLSKPTLSQDGDCKKLTCDGDRIKLDGMDAIIAKPFCKEFEPGTGDFRWTINYRNQERPFLAASCATIVNCDDVNKLNVICDTQACKQIVPRDDRIKCDSGFQLLTRSSSASHWSPIQWIDCTAQTGVWKKRMDTSEFEPLAPTDEITCLSNEEADAIEKESKRNEDPASNMTSSTLTGGGLSLGEGAVIAVVILLALGIISVIVFLVWRRHRNSVTADESAGEVDAKPPTPPNKNPDSDKPIAEVSFSGSRKPPTPSLKTPQPDPSAPKLTKKSVPNTGTPWQTASGKQFEEAVSVTAHPAPPSDGSSTKPIQPVMPSTTPPPLPEDLSKKKVKELLDQSLPSMSE